MRNLIIYFSLLFLLSQCAHNKAVVSENTELKLAIVEAYIQREIPGQSNAVPQVKLTLVIDHNEGLELQKVKILTEELRLNKQKNIYTANFEKDELLTFKGSTANGVLVYTQGQKQLELPIAFKIKEDLYMP